MSHRQITRAFILICLLSLQFSANAQQASLSHTNWQVYFSPRGGVTLAVIHSLDQANTSVLVQAYSFTSMPIAEALARARRRGVNVQVILDKSQKSQQHSVAEDLVKSGIPTFIDAAHAIAHNKVIIIDTQMVITGSFNFARVAEERNAENLLIVRSRVLAYRYIDNWHAHRVHSLPFHSHRDSNREADPILHWLQVLSPILKILFSPVKSFERVYRA